MQNLVFPQFIYVFSQPSMTCSALLIKIFYFVLMFSLLASERHVHKTRTLIELYKINTAKTFELNSLSI